MSVSTNISIDPSKINTVDNEVYIGGEMDPVQLELSKLRESNKLLSDFIISSGLKNAYNLYRVNLGIEATDDITGELNFDDYIRPRDSFQD